MRIQVLVLAKVPLPGRVKTRLCPPCTPEQAARLAAAALADTITVVTRLPAARRVLVTDGPLPVPPGWDAVRQRGGPLSERLVNAFADTRRRGVAALLVGMDTPQLDLEPALRLLATPAGPGAVLGLAADGGWWALGLRDPSHAAVLGDIATSTATTGAETLAAVRGRGLRVAMLPTLRDVDTAADAHEVAGLCHPGSRFAAAVATELTPETRLAGLPMDVRR